MPRNSAAVPAMSTSRSSPKILEVILIGSLDEPVFECLKEELYKFCSLATLSARPAAADVALCQISQDPQLGKPKLVVCFGPAPFEPKAFQDAVSSLEQSMTHHAFPEEHQWAGLQEVMKACMTDEYQKAAKHMLFISDGFAATSAGQKALKEAIATCISIHFAAFLPEKSSTRADIWTQTQDFGQSISDEANLSLTAHSTDMWAVQSLVLRQLRRLLEPEPRSVTLGLLASVNGLDSLSLRAASEVLSIQAAATSQICPCHGHPVQSSMQDGSLRCPVAMSPIPSSQCKPSHLFKKAGSYTLYCPASSGALPLSHQPPESTSARLEALGAIKASLISQSLLFGTPMVLYPWSPEDANLAFLEANEQAFAALCQAMQATEGMGRYGKRDAAASGRSARDPEKITSSQALLQRSEMLIAKCSHNICGAFEELHLPVFVALRPATDTSSLLAMRTACSEEYLPAANLLPKLDPVDEATVAEAFSMLESASTESPLPCLMSNGAADVVKEWVVQSTEAPKRKRRGDGPMAGKAAKAQPVLKRRQTARTPLAAYTPAANSDGEEIELMVPTTLSKPKLRLTRRYD